LIKSLGLFVVTYVATAAMTYGLAHTPVPMGISYAGYACGTGAGFYPLDGLSICGLIAGLLSAFLLRGILTKPLEKTIKAVDLFYMWKMTTLMMLGALIVYRAYIGLVSDCSELVLDYSGHPAPAGAHSIVYSVLNAAIGYLFFDLRRYRFPVEPWRPR